MKNQVAETTLKDYLEENLTVSEFQSLPETMGMTQQKLTLHVNNPLLITGNEIFLFSAVLKMPWEEFVKKFMEVLVEQE